MNKMTDEELKEEYLSGAGEDNITIIIDDKDLRIHTYGSGPGGQHVRYTDSTVKITHLPTNIVVQCQSNLFQYENKTEAMKILRDKLYELELKKKRLTFVSSFFIEPL